MVFHLPLHLRHALEANRVGNLRVWWTDIQHRMTPATNLFHDLCRRLRWIRLSDLPSMPAV